MSFPIALSFRVRQQQLAAAGAVASPPPASFFKDGHFVLPTARDSSSFGLDIREVVVAGQHHAVHVGHTPSRTEDTVTLQHKDS